MRMPMSLKLAPQHRPPPPARLRREEVPDAEWGDWRWQLKHRITTLEELEPLLDLTESERRGAQAAPGLFRIGITPYYFSLIDPHDPFCPVRMQVIPTADEVTVS